MVKDSPGSAPSTQPSLALSVSAPRSVEQSLHNLSATMPSALIGTLSARALSGHPTTNPGGWPAIATTFDHTAEPFTSMSSLFSGSIAATISPFDTSVYSGTSPFAGPTLGSSIVATGTDSLQASRRDLGNFRQAFAARSPLSSHGGEIGPWMDQEVRSEPSSGSAAFFSAHATRDPSLSPAVLDSGSGLPSPSCSHASHSPASSRLLLPACDTRSPSVREHTRSPTEPPELPCAIPRGRRRRREQQESDGDKSGHVCRICQRSFDKKYNLYVHEKRHNPNRKSQFTCPAPNCGQKLGRKTDVSRHVSSVHVRAKKFSCDRCLRRFDRKDTLTRSDILFLLAFLRRVLIHDMQTP